MVIAVLNGILRRQPFLVGQFRFSCIFMVKNIAQTFSHKNVEERENENRLIDVRWCGHVIITGFFVTVLHLKSGYH